MNIREVYSLDLFNQEKIEAFKNFFRPNHVISITGDYHVGHPKAIMKEYTLPNGTEIKPTRDSLLIYSAFQEYLRICNSWNVDTCIFLGDLVSGLCSKLRSNDDYFQIDNQREAFIEIVRSLCKGRKLYFISGTNSMHDSLDTKVHLQIAKTLGGEYSEDGYLYLTFDQVNFFMSHKTRRGALYPLGVQERNVLFIRAGVQADKLPKIDHVFGAHYHIFSEVPGDTVIPAWMGYSVIKGDTSFLGIRQPSIGGMIVLVRDHNYLTIPYVFPLNFIK